MGEGLEIRVPDIGDFEDVEVVEILVAKGDPVALDDPLVSIESDKATMEIPSPAAGVVAELRVSEGDRVSEGSVLLVLEGVEVGETAGAATELASSAAVAAAPEVPAEATAPSSQEEAAATVRVEPSAHEHASPPDSEVRTEPGPRPDRSGRPAVSPGAEQAETAPGRTLSPAAAHPVPDRAGLPHASPLVRRFARELGVSLEGSEGSGAHGRILVDDLKRTVRERFATGASPAPDGGTGIAIPAMPAVDHAAFGPIHVQKLTRIQKVSGPALHRSWLSVPHVTQHDEADVTELERFRRDRQDAARARGVKLSPLLFVMKAVVVALREHPTFRASLAPESDRLIVKDYFHLGIAVDTDQGLIVPAIRDVDQKGIFELAAELAETAERARARKLAPDDLRGACFTISSLGGIGGTAFSPIVNAPEVAILGLSRTRVLPAWRGPSPLDVPAAQASDPSEREGRFEPRLILPLSLSYDHRVIDGAEAVRFTTRLAGVLSDPMQLLL